MTAEESTTIAVSRGVQKDLLSYVHKLEKAENKRKSYSDGIADLLKKNKENKT